MYAKHKCINVGTLNKRNNITLINFVRAYEESLSNSPATIDGSIAPAASGNDRITSIYDTLVSNAKSSEPVQVIASSGIIRFFR